MAIVHKVHIGFICGKKNGFVWVQISPNGSKLLKWVKIAPNGLKWLKMAPNGSKWLQMAPNGSKRLTITGNDSKWLKMASNGVKPLQKNITKKWNLLGKRLKHGQNMPEKYRSWTPVSWPYGQLEPIWTIGTKYGLDQGPYSAEEGRKEGGGGGGERRPLIRLALWGHPY